MVYFVRTSSILCIAAFVVVGSTIGVPQVDVPEPLSELEAVSIAESQPQACFGFSPVNGKWAAAKQQCPANHVLFSIGDDGGKERSGRTINVSSTCCPLPSPDILSDTHVFVYEECPEEFIATGAREVPCDEQYCPVLMRCTRINTDRYQLGSTTAAKYWGNGHAGWRNSERIDHEDIPLGIRFSVGRNDGKGYGADGCVGYPWGSLLTKKSGKYCSSYGFKQLQFSGRSQDPSAGTPVKMFADCDEVHHPHSPNKARCQARG